MIMQNIYEKTTENAVVYLFLITLEAENAVEYPQTGGFVIKVIYKKKGCSL